MLIILQTGISDIPLTPAGEGQVKATAEKLVGEGRKYINGHHLSEKILKKY